MSYMLFFSVSLKKRKNTSWIRLKYQKVTNSEQRFRNVLLVIPSLRNGRTQSVWPCWPDPAGSHSDQCYCRGYDHWHFLLAGTMNTLPWPLSLFFSVCLFLFLSFFSLSSYLLSFSVPSFLEMSSVPLISFSLSEFVFILTAPLPLCSSYRSISLSSLIQHPPPPTFSPSMLPPHSALFLSLSLSTLITPFSLPFL